MQKMTNLYIPACSFLIALLLIIIFFSKKRMKNQETRLFSGLLISSFIDCLVVVMLLLVAYKDDTHFSLYIFNKIDFAQYLIWTGLFFCYI